MSKGFQALVFLLLVLIAGLLLMSVDQGQRLLELEKQHSQSMLQASENILKAVSLKNRRGIPVYVRNRVNVDVRNTVDVDIDGHSLIRPIPVRVDR